MKRLTSKILPVLLVLLLAPLPSCAAEQYTPTVTAQNKAAWIKIRESLHEQRSLVKQPLNEEEQQAMRSILDRWRKMPEINWLQGNIVDAEGRSIDGVAMLIEFPRGDPWKLQYDYSRKALDDGAFNWVSPSKAAEISFFAKGYYVTEPVRVPKWPGPAPDPETPLDKLLMQDEVRHRIDDLVLGRRIVLEPTTGETILDHRHMKVPILPQRHLVGFNYSWADRAGHDAAQTEPEQREVKDARPIDNGFELLTSDQSHAIGLLGEDQFAEQVEPGYVLISTEVDQNGHVAVVESTRHFVSARNENGRKQINEDGSLKMIPVLWPKQITIRVIGDGSGLIPFGLPKPSADSRGVGRQQPTAPGEGYHDLIVITAEDWDNWLEPKATIWHTDPPWYFIRLGETYGRLHLSPPQHKNRAIRSNQLGVNTTGETELGMSFYIQPNGKRNLKTPDTYASQSP